MLRCRCTQCRVLVSIAFCIFSLHLSGHARPTRSRLELGQRSLVLHLSNLLRHAHLLLDRHSLRHRWHGHVGVPALLAHQALLTCRAAMRGLQCRVLPRLLIFLLELQERRVQLRYLLRDLSNSILCTSRSAAEHGSVLSRGVAVIIVELRSRVDVPFVIPDIGVVHDHLGFLHAHAIQWRIRPVGSLLLLLLFVRSDSLPMIAALGHDLHLMLSGGHGATISAFLHALAGNVLRRANCRPSRYIIGRVLLLVAPIRVNHGRHRSLLLLLFVLGSALG